MDLPIWKMRAKLSLNSLKEDRAHSDFSITLYATELYRYVNGIHKSVSHATRAVGMVVNLMWSGSLRGALSLQLSLSGALCLPFESTSSASICPGPSSLIFCYAFTTCRRVVMSAIGRVNESIKLNSLKKDSKAVVKFLWQDITRAPPLRQRGWPR